MDALSLRIWESALADLRAAPTAAERAEVVRRAAGVAGVSIQSAYRSLRKLGWTSGRKQREDKGRSRLGEEALREVSRALAQARNKRGQPNLPMREAHRLAGELGLDAGQVSYGHLVRRLNQAGLGLRHMRAPAAAIARVSQHPNHVWEFDISVAIQWYFREEETGRKLDLYQDAGARFYEGKRENFAVNRVLHRFCIVDHYSGASFVRYYYTAGERAEDVVDFLFRAFGRKDVGEAFPFRGIPRRLVVDPGPACKAALVQNLLAELGVTLEVHMARNAKASGAVETRHNHWQRSFEGRLAAGGFARDLEELNVLAEKWAAVVGGERAHARHGHPPLAMWSRITSEQLVECPDRDTYFQLAATQARTGTLDNRLWLQARNRKWLVRGENVHARQKVQYRLSPFLPAGIRVWDELGREMAAEELRFDESGQAANGRRHVWDDEAARGAAAPPTPAQQVSKAVVGGEDSVALPGVWDDLDRRLQRQAYLERRGRDWAPPAATPLAADPVGGSREAREEIARRLGRPLGEDAAWWRERIGDGITRTALEAAWEEWTRGVAAEAARR